MYHLVIFGTVSNTDNLKLSTEVRLANPILKILTIREKGSTKSSSPSQTAEPKRLLSAGTAHVPQNKAYRAAMGAALTAKAATDPMELGDLFGGGGLQKQAKPKKENFTPDQEMKKNFEKNLSMSLAFRFQHTFETQIVKIFSKTLAKLLVVCISVGASKTDLRIDKLADKAMKASVDLTDTGIPHQQVGCMHVLGHIMIIYVHRWVGYHRDPGIPPC